MLDLDAVKKNKKKIRVSGEVIELDPPDLDTMILIARAEAAGTADQLDALKGFLVKAGLPPKIAGKLDGDQIKAITDHLKDDSKKK